MLKKEDIAGWFQNLQDNICAALQQEDGKGTFREDAWERPGGGGGRSRVIENGSIIEKGGVNFSAVHGTLPKQISTALELDDPGFYATGVSIVIHPYNPMMPIIHMNVRYFETSSPGRNGESTWWFGGGIDLTPHYIVPADATFFHRELKKVCDLHHPEYYERFKKWADDYFYITHRQETRGIGGIFFDRLGAAEGSKEDLFEFVKNVGSAFAPIYCHFMKKNGHLSFDEHQKEWQMIRRSRYVEFNLVWDKGTKFGLQTNGRIESILMSMPPQAHWHYDHQPAANTAEAETLSFLKKGINWLEV